MRKNQQGRKKLLRSTPIINAGRAKRKKKYMINFKTPNKPGNLEQFADSKHTHLG